MSCEDPPAFRTDKVAGERIPSGLDFRPTLASRTAAELSFPAKWSNLLRFVNRLYFGEQRDVVSTCHSERSAPPAAPVRGHWLQAIG